MNRLCTAVLAAILFFGTTVIVSAQSAPLQFATVERPPFAYQGADGAEGFSIDLMNAIAAELGQTVVYTFEPGFPQMLADVQSQRFQGAIANISITASREEIIDFSLPIFESGIGVMLSQDGGGQSLFDAIFTRDFLILCLAAIGLLFGSGMLMWVFERRAQPFFERPVRQALFPSFWWALNLVVNGGFEERMPQSRMGRLFAVVLVISSLFLVSIFVANITAAMTVGALQDGVDSINDLEGRNVATIEGSTSAEFLEVRDLKFTGYQNPTAMFEAFEAGTVDAVVFDSPILAFYVNQATIRPARLMNRTYQHENYGIALASGSALREQINQALLRLREDGTYDVLIRDWFGNEGR